jgi:hypothetical protein
MMAIVMCKPIQKIPMEPFATNADLLETVENRGHDYRTLGRAPGEVPIVAIRSGGDAEPAIVLTAGSHANEQAGVTAAVELVGALDTDHRVYVVPTRDPVGLDGYPAALGQAIGDTPSIDSFDDVDEVLETHGAVVYEADYYTFVLLGDTGFVTRNPPQLPPDGHGIGEYYFGDLEEEDPSALEPFRGRRIYLPAGQPDLEGAGNFNRAYTVVVDPDGRVQHLNRSYDTEWAPVETRCVRDLLAETDPGLFVDLHESNRDHRFWFTMRHKDSPDDRSWEERIGRAVVAALGDAGADLATWEDKFGDLPEEEHFQQLVEDGLYWLDYEARGRGGMPGVVGLNATDYAAENHGLAFSNETGMHAPFDERVEQTLTSVRTAVAEFEARYA